jgi:hypothetical protein
MTILNLANIKANALTDKLPKRQAFPVLIINFQKLLYHTSSHFGLQKYVLIASRVICDKTTRFSLQLRDLLQDVRVAGKVYVEHLVFVYVV